MNIKVVKRTVNAIADWTQLVEGTKAGEYLRNHTGFLSREKSGKVYLMIPHGKGYKRFRVVAALAKGIRKEFWEDPNIVNLKGVK